MPSGCARVVEEKDEEDDEALIELFKGFGVFRIRGHGKRERDWYGGVKMVFLLDLKAERRNPSSVQEKAIDEICV